MSMRSLRGSPRKLKKSVLVGVEFVLSRSEGTPASARTLRVRVVEDEALADQGRVVVEDRAVQIQQAFPVDENLRARRTLEHLVAEPRLFFPRKRVAQSGA